MNPFQLSEHILLVTLRAYIVGSGVLDDLRSSGRESPK